MGRNAQDALSTKVADWDLIEVDYRAGIKTLQQIGDDHGVSKGRISQVAKAKNWARDLSAKIQAQADAKVQAQAAREKLNTEALNDPAKQAKRRLVESDVVEANADVQFRIRMEHRQDIGRTRLLFRTMLEELEVASSTDGQTLMAAMAEATAAEDPAAMRRLLDKITSGPNRIDSAKKLTDVLEKVVKLEREAFGIAAGDPQADLADAMKNMSIALNFIEPKRA